MSAHKLEWKAVSHKVKPTEAVETEREGDVT
jgi:hypothetical protein